LMKLTAKEVVGFHPACAEEHKSFRPTFHPRGSDGPLTKPTTEEVVGFHPACAEEHKSFSTCVSLVRVSWSIDETNGERSRWF
jgi:hypothetical protein